MSGRRRIQQRGGSGEGSSLPAHQAAAAPQPRAQLPVLVRKRKPAWMNGEGTPKGTAAISRTPTGLDLGGLAQGCVPAQSPSLPAGSGVRAALSCPEVLGCCTLAPVPPAGVPRDLPRAAQAGHFGFILDCLGQLSWPCAGATRSVLISKSEVKISPDPNRARSAVGQGEKADAAPRAITACDSTRQGFGGLTFGREG